MPVQIGDAGKVGVGEGRGPETLWQVTVHTACDLITFLGFYGMLPGERHPAGVLIFSLKVAVGTDGILGNEITGYWLIGEAPADQRRSKNAADDPNDLP